MRPKRLVSDSTRIICKNQDLFRELECNIWIQAGKEIGVHLLLSIIATVTCTQAAPMPKPAVVDRVMTVVADDVITESDLRLTGALDARDPTLATTLANPQDSAAQRLIDGLILRQLAGDVVVYQPSPAQVRARVEYFQNQWTDPRQYHRFMDAHGLDDARLYAQMFSRLVIDAYVHRNLSRDVDDTSLEDRRARYAAWIANHRESVRVRHVPPTEAP
jgi:hypothetical protein